MIVCHCNAVRAEEIRTEVRLGARTADHVAARCGAGTRCGGCRPMVEVLLSDEISRAEHGAAAGH